VSVSIASETDTLNNLLSYQAFLEGPSGQVSNLGLTFNDKVTYVDFTDMNPMLAPPTSVTIPNQTRVLPWRYQELLNLSSSASAGNSLVVLIDTNISGTPDTVMIGYVALEVFYCDETRVRYGGRRTNGNVIPSQTFLPGQNLFQLYDTNFTTGTSLAAGTYLVTQTHRTLRSAITSARAPHTLRAIRELYPVEPQIGTVLRDVKGAVGLNDDDINFEPFTRLTTDVIPAITLHTASAVVTGTHPYAEQIGAPVYGSITATQRIRSALANSSVSVEQVRYYARRYGDTSIPLLLTGPTATATITPATFDELPEIVDGWREVTLDLTAAVQVTGGATQDWTWSATGELVGNRWQVLGARTVTVTGTALDPKAATYLAPDLTNVALTWKSPQISGTALDAWADASLTLSIDPPAVTGFGLAVSSQELDVALRCDSPPGCVPTGLSYHHLTWNSLGVCDSFSTDQENNWPNTDSGQAWGNSGGNTATDYDVLNGRGMQTQSTVNVARNSMVTVSAGVQLTDVIVDTGVSALATGDTLFVGPMIGSDTANGYQARLQFRTDGNAYLEVIRRVAGVQATIFTAISIGAYTPEVMWSIRLRWHNGIVYARTWPTRFTEPQSWTAAVADANITSFTSVILRSQTGAASTNVNPIIYWDNVAAMPQSLVDGTLEIQRRDSLTDWQTVFQVVGPGCFASFDDYEARIGVLTEYRIRTLNALDFAGPWVTGSGTIPAPGVYISGTANSLLTFTSNFAPDASLAYIMQFNGQPVEEYSFPEADTVTLQKLFGRDFVVATRPLERGGERFSRIILVNAAAISLPSLANFTSLRDLAWADLDYVCVRDELGNRWFATVIVPEATVRGDRTIYLSRIDVIEVTDTASPLDT
jgi:hypothetical protein